MSTIIVLVMDVLRAKWYLILVLLASTSVNAQINFEDVGETVNADIVFGNIGLGAGISFFDYNNDGLDDISLAASSTNDFQFLKNIGGTFEVDDLEISSYGHQTRQINWVDFDNDGDYDFFAASDEARSRLYRNDGNGNFQDITETCGFLDENFQAFGGSWGDYNNDGWLDLYLSIREGDQVRPNILYRNNGDGTFSDVTVSSGLEQAGYLSFCAAWFDYDNDGYQDLFVANDRYWTSNLLYRNNGDGTFSNTTANSGNELYMDAMSTTIDDYDNDGFLDVYITNTYPQGDEIEVEASAFMHNNGNGTFTDISAETGCDYFDFGWGSVFLDVDNDGDKDLFVNGLGLQQDSNPAVLFEHLDADNFQSSSIPAFDDNVRRSFSCAMGDLENDGKPDIIAMNDSEDPILVWSNNTATSNNYLKIKLEGTLSNRMGVGSKIEISVNDSVQYNYVLCGEGYIAQNSSTEHFGVGDAQTVDYVKVTWLSGMVDFLEDVSVNQTLQVIEGSNPLTIDSAKVTSFSLYPNPAKDMLHFRNVPAGSLVTIYTITGRLILQKRVQATASSVSTIGFSPGVYIAQVGSDYTQFIIE